MAGGSDRDVHQACAPGHIDIWRGGGGGQQTQPHPQSAEFPRPLPSPPSTRLSSRAAAAPKRPRGVRVKAKVRSVVKQCSGDSSQTQPLHLRWGSSSPQRPPY